jgi:hypothetical protein
MNTACKEGIEVFVLSYFLRGTKGRLKKHTIIEEEEEEEEKFVNLIKRNKHF